MAAGGLQRVGYLLHGKGVGCGACSYPQYVDAGFQRGMHMGGCSHFGGREHAAAAGCAHYPGECPLAVALESARLGARLPCPGAEHAHAGIAQRVGHKHHLFLAFGTAWTGNNKRPWPSRKGRHRQWFYGHRLMRCLEFRFRVKWFSRCRRYWLRWAPGGGMPP